MDKFNIVITGIGGQGVITLVNILDEAALVQGYDVKSSELHGLSQRGGSVITHIRFGKKVYSPLVANGEADLIIGLELAETLRDSVFAGTKTFFLVSNYLAGIPGYPEKQQIVDNLKKMAKDKLFLVPAGEICKKELGKDVVAGVYLLGYAAKHNLIPIKREAFKTALNSVIPEKFLDLNIKAFELGYGN